MDQLNLTPFSPQEPRNRAGAYGTNRNSYVWTRRRKPAKVNASSMMAKILICMGILAAVTVGQLFLLKDAEKAVETAGGETSESEDTEDVLGRLRFVSAGTVKSVFHVSQRWNSPVAGAKTQLEEDHTLLRLTGKAGDPVSLAASGEVRAVATDPDYGDYVRISHGNNLESIYYHLSDIRVGAGQPLSAGDTLGALSQDGVLYVAVLQTGERMNPGDYLDVEE